MKRSLTTRFASLTDTGRVRRHNEDAYASDPESGLYVVCDGMGGHAGGEIASSEAATGTIALAIYLRHVADLADRLRRVIRGVNQAVYDRAAREPRLRGMGTTIVLLQVDLAAGDVWIAHAGDSRCYRLRQGALQRLTTDHSFVEEQMKAGLLTAEQARRSHMKNLITRVVGTRTEIDPELARFDASEGDLYLLCSDGLTRDLSDRDLQGILQRHRQVLPHAARVLVDAANLLGGGDNITVMLVEIVAAEEAEPPSPS